LDVNMVIPSTGQRHLLYRQAGNRGAKWEHANILLNSKDNYTIEFEAFKGRARKPVIAIDSVHFSQDCYQPREPSNHTHTCASGFFTCMKSKMCVKENWRCDHLADCTMGEDEAGCFTTTPPPLPPTTTPRSSKPPQGINCSIETEFECADHFCLPSRLQCDGVRDCLGGEDEHIFCFVDDAGRECNFGDREVYCEVIDRDGDVTCLSEKDVCDNVTNCKQGQDESLCGGCPITATYCLFGGYCTSTPNWGPECICAPGYSGHRCQIPPKHSDESSGLLKGLLPILALVLLALIIGVCYWKKKRAPAKSLKAIHFSDVRETENGIENPAYGMQMKDYGGTAKSDLDNNNMQPINYAPPDYAMGSGLKADVEESTESTGIANPLFKELY